MKRLSIVPFTLLLTLGCSCVVGDDFALPSTSAMESSSSSESGMESSESESESGMESEESEEEGPSIKFDLGELPPHPDCEIIPEEGIPGYWCCDQEGDEWVCFDTWTGAEHRFMLECWQEEVTPC